MCTAISGGGGSVPVTTASCKLTFTWNFSLNNKTLTILEAKFVPEWAVISRLPKICNDFFLFLNGKTIRPILIAQFFVIRIIKLIFQLDAPTHGLHMLGWIHLVWCNKEHQTHTHKRHVWLPALLARLVTVRTSIPKIWPVGLVRPLLRPELRMLQ